MTAQYTVNQDVPGFDLNAADANGDQRVNIVDALLMAQLYVGIIDYFPGAATPTPTPQPPCATICPCGIARAAGVVRDSVTNQPIEGAHLSIQDLSACTRASSTSNARGEYSLALYLSCAPMFKSSVSAEGYVTKGYGGLSCGFYEPLIIDVYLDPLQ